MADLLVYRAQDAAKEIRPMQFVMNLPTYQAIADSDDLAAEAFRQTLSEIEKGAHGIDRGWSHKIMIELAYERWRLQHVPHMPSRLTSLFCLPSAVRAIKFAKAEGRSRVYELTVADTDRVVARDMNLYMPPQKLDLTELAFRERLDSANTWADRYWTVDPDPLSEDAEYIVAEPIKAVRQAWTR